MWMKLECPWNAIEMITNTSLQENNEKINQVDKTFLPLLGSF